MDDLWRDIALSAALNQEPTPHRRHSATAAATAAAASFDLGLTNPNCERSLTNSSLQDFLAGPLNRPLSLSSPFPPPMLSPPPEELGLSLNSAAAPPPLPLPSHARQFDAFICSSNSGFGTGDSRHKRMIKNRESAARSRARKQAYTNELEIEVANLIEENAKLKKQYEELRAAMAAQLPTKSTHQRSSSSPF